MKKAILNSDLNCRSKMSRSGCIMVKFA